MREMYWGDNYDLRKQTSTRIGRPFINFMVSGDYIITDYGTVEIRRLKDNKNALVLRYIDTAARVQFTRWHIKDYSDRYLVTLCKRFAKECWGWTND